ncbi:Hsp70 family protein [Dactylosporangium sp. AC04546]|uniref:Hsp70 family protein n=1 Tax=Dactylosporangium sp. AC04546 TaxID=2862460 RepID=UPI001EDE3960|nr:Hsp70 family protein [Dactylosporangium sp. AC04546]WVK81161.1 Hsp70 family protein [Dactylosporangium sp. AC04546]
MVTLGIDVGTSTTVAVLGLDGGRAVALQFDGSPLLPSAVCLTDGGLVTGRAAVEAARARPDAFEPHPKARLSDAQVQLGPHTVPVADLLAALLRRAADEAARVAGRPADRLVLTHPASWDGLRRQVLVQAAANAGLPAPALVPEPVAAARAFDHVVPLGAGILICDLGAGGFDAAVLRRTPEGFALVSAQSAPDAAGLDLDAAIVVELGAAHAAADPAGWNRLSEPSTPADRAAAQAFWDEVRRAKETLAVAPAAAVPVPIVQIQATLTRPQLDQLARPLLERAAAAARQAVHAAGLAPAQLAAVVLTGGGSRLPLAAAVLHQALGVPPQLLPQPELVVASGALLAAGREPAATVPAPPTSGPPTSAQPVSVPPASAYPASAPPASVPPAPAASSASSEVSAPPAAAAVSSPPAVSAVPAPAPSDAPVVPFQAETAPAPAASAAPAGPFPPVAAPVAAGPPGPFPPVLAPPAGPFPPVVALPAGPFPPGAAPADSPPAAPFASQASFPGQPSFPGQAPPTTWQAPAAPGGRRTGLLVAGIAAAVLVVLVVVAGAIIAVRFAGDGAGNQSSAAGAACQPVATSSDPPLLTGFDQRLATEPAISAGDADVTALGKKVLIEGPCAAVKAGQTITVNYVGATLRDGKVFDSSWKHHDTFEARVGTREKGLPQELIDGWDQGLVGVKVGSRVQLDVPPRMAYGDDPPPGAPSGALRFIVDVLNAKD